MRLEACIVGLGGVLAMAGASAACAQTWAPNAVDASPDVEARLTEQTSFRVAPDARFGAQIDPKVAETLDSRVHACWINPAAQPQQAAASQPAAPAAANAQPQPAASPSPSASPSPAPPK